MEYINKILLLVEDDPITAKLQSLSLRKEGFIVFIANTGEQAIEIMNSGEKVDMILMDINLGSGIDGTVAAREILKKYDIPVIFLSSHTEKEIIKKTEKITSYGYVVKNTGISVLIGSINMAFKMHDYHNQLKEKEDAVRKSEIKYRNLYESIKDGIVWTDMKGRILECNQAFMEMLGYSNTKDINKLTYQELTPSKWHAMEENIVKNKIIKTGYSGVYEKEYIKKDGTIISVDIKVWLIRDEHNKSSGMWAIVRDMTEHKRAEEKEKKYFSNILYLAKSATKYVSILSDENIYDYISDIIKEISKAKYIIVNSYNKSLNQLIVESFYAEKDISKKIANLLGTDIKGIVMMPDKFVLNELHRNRIVKVNGGIYELSGRKIPVSVCRSIEKLLNIGSIYAMGFITSNNLYGNAIIFLQKGEIPDNIDILETFINQTSLALEHKAAQDELTQREERFKQLAEITGVWIWETNTHGLFTYSNNVVENILGYTPDEIVSKKYFCDFADNQIKSEVREKMLSCFSQKITLKDFIVDNIHKKGNKKIINTHCLPINDNKGKYVGMWGASIDITEFKNAESALIESEENFRQLIENTGEGIGIVNQEEKFVFSNSMGEKIFGVKQGKLVGRNLKEFCDKNECNKILSLTSVRQRGIISSYELNITSQIGENKTILITASPHFDKNGIFTGSFGVFRDISDIKKTELTLKQNEKLLKESNDTKNKFLSIIAHDLRNPIIGYVGLTKLLLDDIDKFDKNEIKNYLQLLYDSSENTQKLLENLLGWARINSGKIKLNPEMLDLKCSFNENIALVENIANKKNIQIHLKIKDNLIVNVDKNMLNTVLQNLLTNAIKFTKQNGNIFCNINEEKDLYLITIKDTGVGISKEGLRKLFNIKTIYSSKGTGNEIGTGLGLVLCKEFIEKQGGEIWIESEQGKGSEVKFTLPKAKYE